MRIIQHLSTLKTITAGELVTFMPDVPRTTLYRHINTLQKANILMVAKENRVRGTVEKVYALNIEMLTNENSIENATRNAFGFLMKLYADFEQYFKSKDVDPSRDKLFLNNTVLLLSDNEYDNFLGELQNLMLKHISNQPSPDRKARSLSLISAPTTNDKK